MEYASRFSKKPCSDGWIVCHDRIVTVHDERMSDLLLVPGPVKDYFGPDGGLCCS
jgi:hypothetical protein